MISVTSLTKTYGTRRAVDNLSFTVEPGRVTGFVGPNGSGKSTTMRMMVGLTRPNGGHVLYDGSPYRSLARPLQADQKVLIIGASGGVGTYAVQLAKALGVEVTGVGGTGSTDMMTSIGADHVIDYTRHDFVDRQTRYDLVLDIGGRNRIRRLRSVLAPKGTLVIVGGEGGNRLTGGVGRQIRATTLSPFTAQRLTTFISSEHYTNIERLAAYIESGEVVSAIGRRFALAEVPEALRHLDSSSSSGKTVIVIRENEAE